jgi:hypothetical protein
LGRTWQRRVAIDALARPDGGHRADAVVGELVAPGEVDAEGQELALLVTGADADDGATPRELVEGGHRLGQHAWAAIGDHRQVGVEAQPGGVRGGEGQRHEEV